MGITMVTFTVGDICLKQGCILPELKLKRTTESHYKNRKYPTTIFDKRDNLGFYIVNFSH